MLLRFFVAECRRDDSARLVSDPRIGGDETHQSEWALVLGDAGVHFSTVPVFVFIVTRAFTPLVVLVSSKLGRRPGLSPRTNTQLPNQTKSR